MLREERQEVSRCRTLLAWDIDLITNDTSVLSEVEFVCFNCICLGSVSNWTKRQLFSNSSEKALSTEVTFSKRYFPFKELLRELYRAPSTNKRN